MSETRQRFDEMKEKKIKHWHVITMWLVAYDVVAIVMSYFMALWLRFDCRFSEIPEKYFNAYKEFILFK